MKFRLNLVDEILKLDASRDERQEKLIYKNRSVMRTYYYASLLFLFLSLTPDHRETVFPVGLMALGLLLGGWLLETLLSCWTGTIVADSRKPSPQTMAFLVPLLCLMMGAMVGFYACLQFGYGRWMGLGILLLSGVLFYLLFVLAFNHYLRTVEADAESPAQGGWKANAAAGAVLTVLAIAGCLLPSLAGGGNAEYPGFAKLRDSTYDFASAVWQVSRTDEKGNTSFRQLYEAPEGYITVQYGPDGVMTSAWLREYVENQPEEERLFRWDGGAWQPLDRQGPLSDEEMDAMEDAYLTGYLLPKASDILSWSADERPRESIYVVEQLNGSRQQTLRRTFTLDSQGYRVGYLEERLGLDGTPSPSRWRMDAVEYNSRAALMAFDAQRAAPHVVK